MGDPIPGFSEPFSEPAPVVAQPPVPADVGYVEPELQSKAYELYLRGAQTEEQIAGNCGIPLPVLRDWVHRGKWSKRRKEIMQAAALYAESRFVDFTLTHKLPEARRQMALVEQFEKLIQEVVAGLDANDPRVVYKLAQATRAFSDVANTASRLLGITETPATELLDQTRHKDRLFPIGAVAIPVLLPDREVKDIVVESNPLENARGPDPLAP